MDELYPEISNGIIPQKYQNGKSVLSLFQNLVDSGVEMWYYVTG